MRIGISQPDRLGMQVDPRLALRCVAHVLLATLAGWAHRRFVTPWLVSYVGGFALELWLAVFFTVVLTVGSIGLMGLVVSYYYRLRRRRRFTALTEAGLAFRATVGGLIALAAFVAMLGFVFGWS